VGAFKDYQNAVRLSEEMKKAVGFSEIHPAMVYGELFYRVYAGKHTSLKSAEASETAFPGMAIREALSYRLTDQAIIMTKAF
jgi:hypothetical protein